MMECERTGFHSFMLFNILNLQWNAECCQYRSLFYSTPSLDNYHHPSPLIFVLADIRIRETKKACTATYISLCVSPIMGNLSGHKGCKTQSYSIYRTMQEKNLTFTLAIKSDLT